MYILGFILLAIGGTIAYFEKKTYSYIYKREPNDEADVLKVKVIGFLIALVGAALVFIFLR